MYKLCKTEQSAQRQRQLEQGLLDMMQTVRYDEIMVSDLCERLEIPRKSFYRYFTGKDGALHALIDHTMMDYEFFSREWQKGKKRNLQMELETFFEFWYSKKMFLDALQLSGLSGVMIERVVEYSVDDSILPVRFLPGDDPQSRRHVMMFAVCGLLSMVLRWHHGGFGETIAQMAKVAKRLLDQPLFPAADIIMS